MNKDKKSTQLPPLNSPPCFFGKFDPSSARLDTSDILKAPKQTLRKTLALDNRVPSKRKMIHQLRQTTSNSNIILQKTATQSPPSPPHKAAVNAPFEEKANNVDEAAPPPPQKRPVSARSRKNSCIDERAASPLSTDALRQKLNDIAIEHSVDGSGETPSHIFLFSKPG